MEGLELESPKNQIKPRDTYNIAYIIHFLLGAGNLVPWNSFITAVDYFQYLYPNKHIDKVFSVAYMVSSLLVLVILLFWSSRKRLPGFPVRMNSGQVLFILALMTPPVTDWVCGGEGRPEMAYGILVFALVVCGWAVGLTEGSLVGATGELPEKYMQAVFAGNASTGVLVCILRIITKASLPQTPNGLKKSTQIYFLVSTTLILICIIGCNIIHKLPIIQYHLQQRTTTPFKTQTPNFQNHREVEPNEPRKFWNVVRKTRYAIIGVLITYIVTLSIFPGYLTENVESRFFRDWYPILLLTTYNVADFLGKCLTPIYVPKSIGKTASACIARLLFYPMFVACLRGPKWLRTEFPVVALTGALGLTNGYLTSVLMILAPKLVSFEESELVGIVMTLFLVIGLSVGSFLGWLWNI